MSPKHDLTPYEISFLKQYYNSWYYTRRPEQTPPKTNFYIWLIITGRGWGKTLTIMQFVREMALKYKRARIGLIAPTAADVRDTLIEGRSGLIRCSEHDNYSFLPSKRRFVYNASESQCTFYSAEEPNRIRGSELDYVVMDEFCFYPNIKEVMYNVEYALRGCENPQIVIASTPFESDEFLEFYGELDESTTVFTTGTTLDNRDHLPSLYLERLLKKYDNTTIGLRELYGQINKDVSGTLWKFSHFKRIDEGKCSRFASHSIIAVDPALTSKSTSDETGIVAIRYNNSDNTFLIGGDYSMKGSPSEWGNMVVNAYRANKCQYVVYESNAGGDLIPEIIHQIDPNVPCRDIYSEVSKRERMLPVLAHYEQGRVYHVAGLDALEKQMVTWTPNSKKSPDRIDAVVHGITYLTGDIQKRRASIYF